MPAVVWLQVVAAAGVAVLSGAALVRAPALGLRKVLVTCGDSNLASARVIEKAGGVLEDVRETLALIRP